MRRKKYQGGGNGLFTIVIVVSVVVLFAILIYEFQNDRLQEQKMAEMREQEMEDRLNELADIRDRDENDSFFQKLADGLDVSILIIGDSIGAGAGVETANGKWYALLQEELWKQYHVRAELTNISLGGNTSYAGYARAAALDDQAEYDLAIICYGQNDAIEDFSFNYELIIRTIKRKYPNCSILSILESSQREYTPKMQIIQQLADYYGYPTVDTITPFSKDYDALTSDGVHPNDAGQRIYFEEVFRVIARCVEEYRGKEPDLPSPINSGVTDFDAFRSITASEFERINDLTYCVSINISGTMGIDYNPSKSTDKTVEIYVDDLLLDTLSFDFGQRHILIVADHCEAREKIRIVFKTKEAADGFYGLYFSGME